MATGAVHIARCPEHGLHGERTECFVCGGPVEQVPMVTVSEHEATMAELGAMAQSVSRVCDESVVTLQAEAERIRDYAAAPLPAAPLLKLLALEDRMARVTSWLSDLANGHSATECSSTASTSTDRA